MALKRIFDLSVLILAHALLFPIWLLLWAIIPLLIWLEDRGPIFYKQQRAGKNGKTFTILKFRTMVVDADKIGPIWTKEQDPRITHTGRILRKTALDELPELLSIWRGNMTFVGPRALAAQEQRYLEEQTHQFRERLKVKPGLTGLAQLYNHTDDPRSKLKYDLIYIEKQNLWLDIKIIVLSLMNTATGRWDTRKGKAKQENH